VRCSGCGADVPLLREFCGNCGTPTDAGLREARLRGPDERSPEELKRNRKTVLIGAAAVLLALGVAGKFSWPAQIFHINSHEHARGPVTIGAEELVQAYHKDAHSAARRFRGREMVVSGEFLRLVPDGYGSLDMRLKTSNADGPLGVDLAGVAIDDAKRLRPGQQVTVSCQRIAGSGDDRWLQDCAVEPAATQGAAPTPPAPPATPTAPTTEGNSG
jgi:hypothetical protein